MGKTGKISVIPKDYGTAFPTMEKSLRDKRMSRSPGTVVMRFPYRELNGKYRTGLDENAKYIDKIEDPKDKDMEIRRVKELRKKLEDATGIDLSPTSQFYNHTSRGNAKVDPVKLVDGDNIFNLDDPWQAITYNWLRVHPTIAASMKAYETGQYPSDTQYFVNDDDVENEMIYRKKKDSNDCVIKFHSWSLEKRRKIARLLDLPVDEETREEVVYNMVDNFLKEKEVLVGTHKGLDPVRVFTNYANLTDNVVYVKDLVEQAFRNQIYKEKKGLKVYEGELQVYKSKEELVEHLLDDANQEDVLLLEKKIKLKKIAKA